MNITNHLISKIKDQTFTLKDVPKEIKKDKKIILNIVRQYGMFLQFGNKKIKNDKNLVLIAVKQNGLALKFVSDELKNNEKIVLDAVNQNGMALEYTNNFLQNEKIIIAALNQNITVLNFLHRWVKNYENIFNNFDFVNNKEIIFKIIKHDPSYYKYLSNTIKEDINITKELVNINSNILYFASKIMCENIDILLLALDNNYNIIDIISPKIHKIKEIALKIIDYYDLKNQYKKSRLRILHIGFVKLDNTFTEDYIEYKFIDINLHTIEDIIKYFNRLLDIKDIDIVIFIELNTDIYSRYTISQELITMNKKKIVSLYDKLNKLIYVLTEPYINIKIISIVTNNKSLKFSHKFYKIINIIVNKDYNITRGLRHGANYDIKNTIYKKMNLNTDNIIKNDMLATHWINNLINTPKFLRGRQIQLSGTCWFNVIFNSLFLVDSIKKEMYLRYEKYKKTKSANFPIEYKNLRNPDYVYNVYDILYSLIGNLKNDILPVINYGDYIIVISAYIKEYIQYIIYEKNIYFNKLVKNKSPDKPLFTLCKASNSNELRNTLCSDKIKNKQDLNNLNDLCFYTYPKSICDTYAKNSDEEHGYIYGNIGSDLSFYDFFKILFNTNIKSSIPIQLENISILMINVIDTPNYILSKNDINKNGIIYKLKSCYLYNITTDDTNHVICGIKTNNTYYVYDSNTIWAKEDWSKLLKNNHIVYPELLNFKKKFMQKYYNINTDPNYFKFYIGYLIYVSHI